MTDWYSGQNVDVSQPPPEWPKPEGAEGEAAVHGDKFKDQGRNNLLTSLAGGWRGLGMDEDGILVMLRTANQTFCKPPLHPAGPLPDSELENIARSMAKKPKGTDEEGEYTQVKLAKLRKYIIDPPRYILEVNGQDVELTSEELHTNLAFRKRVREMLNLLAQPCRTKSWDMKIQRLLKDRVDIELPKDQASVPAQVIDLMHEFLVLRKGAKIWDDVLRNLPFEVEGVTWFRPRALIGHLQHRRLTVSPQHLSTILSGHGLHTKKWKIKGKEVELWGLPSDKIVEQTEAFTPTVLNSEEEEF